MNAAHPKPDLSEARRLLDAGLRLVKLKPFSKAPEGEGWNLHAAGSIDATATGYGALLADNHLCSLDPDNYRLAKIGMAALGFDLDSLLAQGVRTTSTRPASGGRSTFRAEGEIGWVKFASKENGTVLELRAESENLQDCVPGIVYRAKDGTLCTQRYANSLRLDEPPPIPDELWPWWERCSTDREFLHEQQKKFFEAIALHVGSAARPNLSLNAPRGDTELPFSAPGIRGAFNRAHDVATILDRHGYAFDARQERWSPPGATGAPGIRPVPNRDGLWRSDHGSDPLCGTFDAWIAHVVLDHGGDCAAAINAWREQHRGEPDASPSPEPEPAAKIASLDWASCARRTPPPFEWVIPHWLSLHPALWAGRGGIGKTLLAQTAGTALATQRPFIGDIARPYTVGVFACEDDADELQRRQANINAHFGLDWGDLDRLHVAVREGQPNVLFEPEFGQLRFTSTFELLRQWVNDLRIEVLFVDNVSQVYAGPAGDNGAVTRFVNGLRGIWRDFKGAPVLLAHPARATGSEFSGAAAWENAVRMRWWLGDTPPDMPESDAEPSTTVRYLAKRKANYTDRDLMRLNFIDGVLVPETIEPGTSGTVANLENAKAIVVDGMRHLLRMNQQPSDKPGANYLPKLLIDFKLNGNHQKKALVDAMHALMTGGVIERCVVGKYANRNPRYGLRFMQKECPW